MSDDTFNIIFPCGLIGVLLLFVASVGGCVIGTSQGVSRMEQEAIHGGYGSYNEDGNFRWQFEIEKENLLKDLEFFKRMEQNRAKMTPVPEIIPLPKTGDLFN